jgi:hypothetical protein
MTTAQIKTLAENNAKERLMLIKKMQKKCERYGMQIIVSSFDRSFCRKLFNTPGDLSTHRIAKVASFLIKKGL